MDALREQRLDFYDVAANRPGPDGSGTAATGSGSTPMPPATGATGSSPASPATVGTGADTLVLALSERASQGDAQFTVTVDGKPVGPAQSVTAVHGQGQPEAFTFKGDWGTGGSHTVGISFSNPVAGSTADMSRSLYLDSASYDGHPVQGSTQVTGGSPVTFSLTPGTPQPAPADTSGTQPGTLTVTDGSGGSTTVPLIASGSHADHPSATSTIRQAVSNGVDTITSSGSVKGEAATLGAGPQKLVLVNPRAMVLTGGSGADTVTADTGLNRFVAGSGSLDVTGGSDATGYVLHAGSGSLVVEDFDLDKGDTLTVDKSLQGALAQAPDGHGGTLLSFGAKQGSVDLVNHASLSPSNIAFI